MGVDYVGCFGRSAQITCSPRCATVESHLGRASEETGKESLARAGASPRLGDTPRGCEHPVAATACCLDQGRYLAITAIKRDEPTGVEYEAHLGGSGSPFGLLLQDAIGVGNLCVCQRAELLFPSGHCLSQRFQA